jgi:hypothetical protein
MEMKKINMLITALLLAYAVSAQKLPCEKTMEQSLQQTAEILNKSESLLLWNVPLNASIIIIDHFENKMYFTAIENGEVQPVKEEEWNNKVPLANSFFDYEGKRYVTIYYCPLNILLLKKIRADF